MKEDMNEAMNQDLLDLEEFDEEAIKKESEELATMKLLTKKNVEFKRTSGGFVSLKTEDKAYDRVGFYLTFPLTNPEEFISVREADEKAREIGIIEKLTDLEKDQQDMVREQIRLRYFMPTITKVIDLRDEYGYAYWNVMTTFGACRFTTQITGNTVISLGNDRYLVTDIDGNRYDIPNFYALSVTERKKLDMFI